MHSSNIRKVALRNGTTPQIPVLHVRFDRIPARLERCTMARMHCISVEYLMCGSAIGRVSNMGSGHP